jgi:hypothetical protein
LAQVLRDKDLPLFVDREEAEVKRPVMEETKTDAVREDIAAPSRARPDVGGLESSLVSVKILPAADGALPVVSVEHFQTEALVSFVVADDALELLRVQIL